MPRIRLLNHANIDGAFLQQGEEVDVHPDVADMLVSLSRAELVTTIQPETPERKTRRRETR